MSDNERRGVSLATEGADAGPQGTVARSDSARAMAEVQAAVIMAKRYPRDTNVAYTRILESCKRQSLAEQALYAYPRGKELVEGPSIRLAEVLAQAWGNMDWGLRELSQGETESEVEAFAWDLETNMRRSMTFTVPHVRYSKERGRQRLGDDPRDTYEVVANQGARRMRACVLAVIPGDIIDAAVDQVRQTLEKGGGEPLVDRIRKMTAYFHEIGVPAAALEKFLGHKLDVAVEAELVRLKAVAKSIRDGFAKREDYFDLGQADPDRQPKPASQLLRELEEAGKGDAQPAEVKPAEEAKATVAETQKAEQTSQPETRPEPNSKDESVDTFQASTDPLTPEQKGQLATLIGRARLKPAQVQVLRSKYGVEDITNINLAQFKEIVATLTEQAARGGKGF